MLAPCGISLLESNQLYMPLFMSLSQVRAYVMRNAHEVLEIRKCLFYVLLSIVFCQVLGCLC